jgi:hypothetical protein
MSEEKIIQHAANAIHVLQDKKKRWVKKLKEFFLEILVIVFAVSITLLFHNWNDTLHEHRQEREFLAGIKSDLDSGALSIDRNIAYFQPTIDYFVNVRQQLTTRQINTAYIDSNSWALKNTFYFGFDMGRFEGFKSSGYLRLVENQTLLKHLMTLYTISIPFQIEADRMVFNEQRQFFDYNIGPKATFCLENPRDGRIFASKLLDDPAFRYYIINYSSALQEKEEQKKALILQMRKLSAEIGEQLDK